MSDINGISRAEEVTQAAMKDGLISGALMGIPSTFAVWTGMRYPNFVKATNWQSRTALVIMPALFVFALTAEQKVSSRMREMTNEKDHSREGSKWATERQNIEQQHAVDMQEQHNASAAAAGVSSSSSSSSSSTIVEQASNELSASSSSPISSSMANEMTADRQSHALYRKSVKESGVRIIPGNSLGVHHEVANFWQENPFKILAGLGIPTVFYIFRGQNNQKHMQLQSKLMHTRVYGQFAVLTMLLTLMGFKSYMDSWGTFITEEEAEYRVADMERARRDLVERIAFDRKLDERRKQMLRDARKGDNSKPAKKVKKVEKEISGDDEG